MKASLKLGELTAELSSPEQKSPRQKRQPIQGRMKRSCPYCTLPLDAVKYKGVELDHCRRCGGTFLDPGEEASTVGAAVSPSRGD